jgi:leucyl aminopeptidase
MEIVFHPQAPETADILVLGCYEEKRLSSEGKKVDALLSGFITHALEHSKFKGALGQSLVLTCPQGSLSNCLVVMGLGKEDTLDAYGLEKVGGSLYTALTSIPETTCHIHMASVQGKNLSHEDSKAHIIHGYVLRSWRFDDLKTKKLDELPKALKSLTCVCTHPKEAEAAFQKLDALAQGVHFTRELVTLPPNMLYPASMAKKLQELSALGLEIEVLEETRLKEVGMGALIGVAQGSSNRPCVVLMKWMHGPKDQSPLAFIGKGVTFDSGGLNIKPTGSMEDMKYDMAGAGTVAGLMKSLALGKVPLNIIGAVGLVENMVSGDAQRPSDVVKTLSGQTVEVLNTDAEGRLVLCDVMSYVQKHFKPSSIIDLATLTGAIVIALGDKYAGLFSNNDALAEALIQSGKQVHEHLWRFPMGPEYDKDLDSDIADMKNIGGGRKAGSITAAQFLRRFVENDTPWAHLDIAGVAWADKAQDLCEKGASAFGLRLLHDFIMNQLKK